MPQARGFYRKIHNRDSEKITLAHTLPGAAGMPLALHEKVPGAAKPGLVRTVETRGLFPVDGPHHPAAAR